MERMMWRQYQLPYVGAPRFGITILIIAILALLLSNNPVVPQPAIADDEGTTDNATIELPPKGNPKLDSTLNSLASVEAVAGPPHFLPAPPHNRQRIPSG
jgi:hypothetical protein